MTGFTNVERNLFLPQIPSKNISLTIPGISKESRDTVAELLEQSHIKYHCFFNEKKFHNHLAHGVLAAYSLGARPDRIRAIYNDHAATQRPIGSIEKNFTQSDWKSELGNAPYYASYLEFFRSEVKKIGRVAAFTKYALDQDMIGRSFAGAFHPLIHMGYGFDFDVDGIFVEGLAMTAVTTAIMTPFVVRPANAIEKVTAKVATQLSLSKSAPKTIVDILNDIREDHDLDDVIQYSMENKTIDAAKHEKVIAKIQQSTSAWEIAETAEDIEAKSKELYQACVLAIGSTGLRNTKVKQDFFLMHATTSVLFAHKIALSVAPNYAVSVLKSHFGAVLLYYISRGRPAFDIDALLQYKGKEKLDSTNPWLSLIKRAIDIDEVHVTKVVRSCAYGDLLFGAEGSYSQLCINTAEMALDLGGDWEFEGVGYDEAYTDRICSLT